MVSRMSVESASDTGFDSFGSDDNDDDIVEEFEVQGSKRKLPTASDEAGTLQGKKRRKLAKENAQKELHKPPTAEELNRLRETENLFHSNLFRLQVAEMIKEIQLKQKYKAEFEVWFDKFQTWVLKMEDSEDKYELADVGWLKKLQMKPPVSMRPAVKGSYHFRKPSKVQLIGSYAHGYCLGPKVTIDVMVEMPKTFFQKEDYLNSRYLRKRALYLCEVAHHVEAVGNLAQEVHFVADEGDTGRPMLELSPMGKLGKHVTVLVRAVPQPGTFKLGRFAPSKNNVRPSWFLQGKHVVPETQRPTPFYNSSVMADVRAGEVDEDTSAVISEHGSLKEALVLMKVWLRQRELEREVTGFVAASLLCHLVHSRRISPHMSSYQVLRIACTFLASPDLTKSHSLCSETGRPVDFTSPLVFVDRSGYHNVTAGVSQPGVARLRHEAAVALHCLDTPHLNSFHLLFMTKVPFHRNYDHLIVFRKDLENVVEAHGSEEGRVSHGGVLHPQAAGLVWGLLERGFGARVRGLHVRQPELRRWKAAVKPPRTVRLVLGLRLDPEGCLAVVDKAQGEHLAAAEAFRELWGARSELRRFQDGSITEAVVWEAGTVAERRLIVRQVARHLLRTKLGIGESDFAYIADQLGLVAPDADERTVSVLGTFDALTKQLRGVTDLPLDVVSVQGVSPVFRYSEVCPPSGWAPGGPKAACPPWVAPVDAVLQLGPSNKWPRDVEAVRRIRAAFNVKIAESANKDLHLRAQAYQDGFEVLKEGLVFRLAVFYPGEVALMKQTTDDTGLVQYKDTARSSALERSAVHLPRLTSALHGLHTQHSAYGPSCRLVKRWLSAHLLDTAHVSEEALDLLVAALFLRPEPQVAPCEPQAAFMRFLHFMSTTNWNSECIVLNFNGEMNREEVLEVESHFAAHRGSLPVVFLATPQDRLRSPWTQHGPSALILLRMVELSRGALADIEAGLLARGTVDTKALLTPNLNIYDVVIHLTSTFNNRRFTRGERPGSKKWKHKPKRQDRDAEETLPAVGFDPVACFMADLRSAYDDVALFFRDVYGGNVVAVLWKPSEMEPRPFRTSHVNCRQWNPTTNQLELNKDAIIEDFAHLGQGLVMRVDVKQDGQFVSSYINS